MTPNTTTNVMTIDLEDLDLTEQNGTKWIMKIRRKR